MRRLVWLLLGALLLSGCGSTAPPSEGPGGTAGGSPATDDGAPPVSATSPGPAAESLAAAAEQQARELRERRRRRGQQEAREPETPRRQSIHPRDGPVTGADVSYPNCPKRMGIPQRETKNLPMPLPAAEFVIIGLTNGPGYFVNPCLAQQVAWAEQHDMMVAAYHVLSYPNPPQWQQYGDIGPYDASTRRGRLRNIGRAQALLGMNWMQRAGLVTPVVWLDVEPVSDWEWSDDTAANVAVITGAVRTYQRAGYRVGFYSVPSLWSGIAGDWGLGLPEWRSAGGTSRAQALTRCSGSRHSFQGGPAIIAQWWDDKRDHDVTCPGVAQHLGRWFHQY